MKRKYWLAGIMVVPCLMIGLTGWAYFGAPDFPDNETVSQQDRFVAVEPVTKQPVAQTTRYSGVIEAFQRSKLVFRVEGPLIAINVRPGDSVKKGDVLMQIDPRDFQNDVETIEAQIEAMKSRLAAMENGDREEDRRLLRAQVDSAKARTDFAVQELKRAESLLSRKAVSEAEYDEKVQNEIHAKMELRVAEEELAKGEAGARAEDIAATKAEIQAMEAKLRMARNRLADTTLLAPFDGIVTNRMIENHEMVSLYQEVIALHDISKLKVRVFLPENELIRRSQSADTEVDVVLTENDSQSYQARLFEVDTNPTETKGMYAVTYLFDAPKDINVLPGMTAEITISDAERPEERLVVPAVAVFGNELGENCVWVFDSSTSSVSKRIFQRGMLTSDEKYVVMDGLAEGTFVVTEGNRFLAEDAKVHVK